LPNKCAKSGKVRVRRCGKPVEIEKELKLNRKVSKGKLNQGKKVKYEG